MIDAAVAYLLDAEPPATPRFSGWHAKGLDEPTTGTRLAWCYGDLGIAFALYRAARARGRDDPAEALALARNRGTETQEQAGVLDAGLCHGTAGVAHLYMRRHRASGDAELGQAARIWLDRTLALRTTHAFAGFPSWIMMPGGTRPRQDDRGRIAPDGCDRRGARVAAMICELEPSWVAAARRSVTRPRCMVEGGDRRRHGLGRGRPRGQRGRRAEPHPRAALRPPASAITRFPLDTVAKVELGRGELAVEATHDALAVRIPTSGCRRRTHSWSAMDAGSR